jgi:hypothetical protein
MAGVLSFDGGSTKLERMCILLQQKALKCLSAHFGCTDISTIHVALWFYVFFK